MNTAGWAIVLLLSSLAVHADDSPRVLFQWMPGEDTRPTFEPDEPLVTDRPDFTEASSTVGHGVTQIETGYIYSYNSDDGETVRGQSFGEPLFRHGIVANWLELRIAVFPVQERTRTATTSDSTAGTEDLLLGLKIGLTAQEGVLPEMAVMPQMTVPTGSNAFTDDQVLPGVNWLYGWDISEEFATGGSTQFFRAVDGETDDTFTLWAQSWTMSASLTDQLSGFFEWYGLFPSGAETEQVQHYLNGGFTYLITNDVQFDLRAGWGLNHAADDFFAGTGLCVRFR
ncbi:MAG: transporter [Planctomycetaceae bacterium]